MGFLRSKYKSDAGGVYNIRVSTNTLTVTGNAPPTEAVTDRHVEVSVGNHGSKRKAGINARGLVLERFTGTGEGRKRYTTFLPILDPTAFTTFAVGEEVPLGAVNWTVASDVAET